MIGLLFNDDQGDETAPIAEYQRYLNVQDRLGRTCAHLLFSSNLLDDQVEFYTSKCQLTTSIRDTDGQTPLDYAIQSDIPSKIDFKTETKEDVEHLLDIRQRAMYYGS